MPKVQDGTLPAYRLGGLSIERQSACRLTQGGNAWKLPGEGRADSISREAAPAEPKLPRYVVRHILTTTLQTTQNLMLGSFPVIDTTSLLPLIEERDRVQPLRGLLHGDREKQREYTEGRGSHLLGDTS
jgi:hypothetical protein